MIDDLKGTIILYSVSDSEECRIARTELTALNIPFIDIPLDIFPQCRTEMEELTGYKTVPQIFFNEICIGGLEGLQQLANDENRLDALMEMVRTTEPPSDAPSLPEPEVSACKSEYSEDSESMDEQSENSADEATPPNTEYTLLLNNMKKANVIKDNLVGTKKLCRNSFKGEDFIKWIMNEKKLKRSEAIDLGQKLVSQEGKLRKLTNSDGTFDPDRFYEVYEAESAKALNQGPTALDPIDAESVNQILIAVLTPLYEEILSNNNRIVNYACLQSSENFKQYLAYCTELQRVKITEETPEDVKIALFLNIYNIMLIHIHHKFGHPSNIWQRRKLMWNTYYLIDKKLYSLQSILNGILRGNKKSFEMLWKPFGKTDHRRKLTVKNPDPSVLFAITSSSRSTNPIRLYTATNLKNELTEATQNALASEEYLLIDPIKKTVAVSPIFNWYAADFGLTQDNLIQWILAHMKDSTSRTNLKRLSDSKSYNLDYLDYDWTPNVKKSP
ncbi:unnamed protein product [Enterobius vermicularis]|uniref:Glutaredoxin domain-containing protein n=1 Tax=Enterobius vermicularis TaxID=51028 RepID=A0A0N4UYL9_ENTVE|nr:unnamed protein product [Enterobius vermicularis]